MASGTIRVDIPLDALMEAIKALSAEDKRRLYALLDDELMAEEGNAQEEAEVAQAHAELEAGDYVSLDDIIAEKDAP